MSLTDFIPLKDLTQNEAIRWASVGSKVICNPPPMGSDYDFLVLVKKRDASRIASLGFKLDDGSAHYDPSEGKFNSWRRGEVNLIVTDDPDFFDKFVFATKIARSLNLFKREDRVTLFQAILYNKHKE